LILKKISKIGATRCQILRLKCIKIDFGSGPYPAGVAYSAPPDPLALFMGPTSKEKEGKGREEGNGRGREGKGEGNGREGR